jgi:hypothetical protein
MQFFLGFYVRWKWRPLMEKKTCIPILEIIASIIYEEMGNKRQRRRESHDKNFYFVYSKNGA